MAIVKYGAIITDMSGKIGGQTFKKTGAGSVMQNTNSSSRGTKLSKADAGRVVNTNQNQSAAIAAWQALSAEDRLTWTSGAINFPFVNKIGETYQPSGYQLFMSVNNNLQLAGQSIISTCPAPGETPAAPSFTITAGSPGVTTFSMSSSNTTGCSMILMASQNQSAGRAYEAGRMRVIRVIPDTQTWPFSVDSSFESVFGTIPASGNFWFETYLINETTGRAGQSFIVQYSF